MKPIAVVFLIVSQLLFVGANAQEIRFDILIIRVPEATATAMAANLREPSKVAAAREQLISQLGRDAELVDWPTLTMKPGQSVVENIDEVRYPTGFESPSILLEVPDGATDVPTPSAPDVANETGKKKGPVKIEGELKLVGGVPTTFEVKNVGVSFQVEPQIVDALRLEFNFSLQHTIFMGNKKTVIEVSPTHKISVEQPQFQTLKTTSNMTVTSGQPVMLSFHKLREPNDKVEIAICTATIVDTRTEKQKSEPAK